MYANVSICYIIGADAISNVYVGSKRRHFPQGLAIGLVPKVDAVFPLGPELSPALLKELRW